MSDQFEQYVNAMSIDKETGKPIPRMEAVGAGYDDVDQMYKVKSLQKKWKTDFIGNELNPNHWEVLSKGNGQSISVANGELSIATGVAINEETVLLSKEIFQIPLRTLFGFTISQKIINQEFYLELVSVDPKTGIPDGMDKAAWKISANDSLTNDFAVYQVQTGGLPILSSAAVDTNATQIAPSYALYELELFSDEAWFHAKVMDSATGRTYSNARQSNIPHPNRHYKVQIRVKNLSTAPASNTNFKMQFVNVTDYAELTAEITAGRGNTSAGQAIAVSSVGGSLSTVSTVTTVTTDNVVSKNLTAAVATTAVNTTTPFLSAALDATSSQVYTKYRARFIYDQPIKVEFLHGSSATATANKVQQTITIPANTPTVVEFPLVARYGFLRVTNTGTATTTVHEILGMLMGL